MCANLFYRAVCRISHPGPYLYLDPRFGHPFNIHELFQGVTFDSFESPILLYISVELSEGQGL